MRVSVAEAAHLLSVNERTIRRRLRAGQLSGGQVFERGKYRYLVEIPDDVSGSVQAVAPDTSRTLAELTQRFERELVTLTGQQILDFAALHRRLDRQDAELARLRELLEPQQLPELGRRAEPWYRRLWRALTWVK